MSFVRRRIFKHSLLTPEQLEDIAQTIEKVERQTAAELVTVLAKKADQYLYIPTLWAAILALLTPLVVKLTPLWLSGDALLELQWLIFIIAAVAFRLPFLTMLLVPKSVKQWRASSLARRQFLEQNLHHTEGETGVLIFVAEAERYIEIIADRGVSRLIDDGQWQAIIDRFIAQVHAGRTHQGFIDCIESCGALLAEHLPCISEKDELPNHLVVLS